MEISLHNMKSAILWEQLLLSSVVLLEAFKSEKNPDDIITQNSAFSKCDPYSNICFWPSPPAPNLPRAMLNGEMVGVGLLNDAP